MSVTPIATEQDTDPIDWEAKFHKAVSANVRQADTHKRRTAEIRVENQQLRARITELAKFEADANALVRERASRVKECRRYDEQIAILLAKIRELEDHKHRGQRVVMEDVRAYLDGLIAALAQ